MANWTKANTGAFIPDALTPLIASAQATASSASTILDVIKTAIDLLKNFLIGFPPFDFLGALATQVENFKNNFLATGIFALNMWDYPLFQFNRSGGLPLGELFEQSFELDATNAFFDTKDPNVPPFTGDAAALLLVAGAPSIDAVLSLVRGISDAFSWWTEIAAVVDQLSRVSVDSKVREVQEAIKNGDIVFSDNPSEQTITLLGLQLAAQQAKDLVTPDAFETNIVPACPDITSTPKEIQEFVDIVATEVKNAPYPNFQEISLRTIVPALQQTVDNAFDPLVTALATGRSITDTIDSFVETLENKIAILDSIATAIGDILSQLDALTSLTTLSALFVETSDGMQGLSDEIKAAGSKPLGSTPAFFTGLVLVGGGTGLTAFKNLFGPIGTT